MNLKVQLRESAKKIAALEKQLQWVKLRADALDNFRVSRRISQRGQSAV
ncbi:MAG: hypothetical protein JST57_04885 [Bacteroidetes bacterium]|jgi:hypothetical protein|nr:hypothetical protein [Bacteroidota bacterium]